MYRRVTDENVAELSLTIHDALYHDQQATYGNPLLPTGWPPPTYFPPRDEPALPAERRIEAVVGSSMNIFADRWRIMPEDGTRASGFVCTCMSVRPVDWIVQCKQCHTWQHHRCFHANIAIPSDICGICRSGGSYVGLEAGQGPRIFHELHSQK
jgi:hypothetical protein